VVAMKEERVYSEVIKVPTGISLNFVLNERDDGVVGVSGEKEVVENLGKITSWGLIVFKMK
jgi:sugar diacid utilization regulator